MSELIYRLGIDIGSTLIGMHLKKVAVPVRLENNTIGEATIVKTRTRPKFIGGARAVYEDKLFANRRTPKEGKCCVSAYLRCAGMCDQCGSLRGGNRAVCDIF